MIILSPWVFLPLHLIGNYPLLSWYKNGKYNNLAAFLHLFICLAEHWTTSFPGISALVIEYVSLPHIMLNSGIYMIANMLYILFFYYSYYNTDKKNFVLGWIILTAIMMAGPLYGALPKETVEEAALAMTTDHKFSVAHFMGHCYLLIMVWSVNSVTNYPKNEENVDDKEELNGGDMISRLVEKITKSATSMWESIFNHPHIFSIGVCVVSAVVGIGIHESSKFSIANSDIPFFPHIMCRVEIDNEDECTYLGITVPCHKSFSEDSLDNFGFGLQQSHNWTFASTFFIGLISLWKADLNRNNFRWKSLKITCALYAMETACFSLARFYWGVSKPLVLIAAIHNLFEWSILAHVAEMNHPTKSEYQQLCERLVMATTFICFVVAVCMVIPNLFLSLAFEQLFGIVLDITLPIVFVRQMFHSDPDKRSARRKLYWMPAAAHSIHLFGTILPLVLAILLSGNISWFSDVFLEILINLCVPLAHLLYCIWSFQVGALECEASGLSAARIDKKGYASTESALEQAEQRQTIGYISEGFRIKNVSTTLILGFLLGQIPLVVLPYLFMPVCDVHPCVETQYEEYQGRINDIGSIIKEGIQEEYPGLVEIDIGQVNHQVAHDQFYFTEKWLNMESMKDGLLSSFVNLSENEDIISGYDKHDVHTTVSSAVCANDHKGALTQVSTSSCGSLWKVVNAPSYCGTIPGCKYMKQLPGSVSLVELYMDDGSVLNAIVRTKGRKSKEVSTLGDSHPLAGYKGTLSLTRHGLFGCEIEYVFRNNVGGSSRDALFDHVHNTFVPDLYTQLSN